MDTVKISNRTGKPVRKYTKRAKVATPVIKSVAKKNRAPWGSKNVQIKLSINFKGKQHDINIDQAKTLYTQLGTFFSK